MGKLRADGPGVNLSLQTASPIAARRLLSNVEIIFGYGRGTAADGESMFVGDERKSESTS